MSDAVLVERRGRILVITINRPQARNAINLEVSQALADAMDELDDSPDLSVAILTGAGGNFCAGMDLKAFAAGERVAVEGRGLGFTQKPPRKPVIAAVEGFALAGGTELVLATDLVVASRSARFGIPEVRRGLVAGAGGLLRLPRKIPYQKALELALTGDDFTAEQAAGWGLANILTEDGGLWTELSISRRRSPRTARWPSPSPSGSSPSRSRGATTRSGTGRPSCSPRSSPRRTPSRARRRSRRSASRGGPGPEPGSST